MEGDAAGDNAPAVPAEETSEEAPAEEPTSNGGEDDIMSAMSLDAVAEAEQAHDDDTTNEDE